VGWVERRRGGGGGVGWGGAGRVVGGESVDSIISTPTSFLKEERHLTPFLKSFPKGAERAFGFPRVERT